MSFKKLMIPAAIATLALPFSAHADDDTGFFVGLGLSRADVSANQFDESQNEPAFKLGYMLNDNYGFELDVIDIGTTSAQQRNIDVGIVAISAVGSYSLTERLEAYGKLGAAEVALSLKQNDVDITDEESTEFFWAVGGELDFGAANIYLEYNRFDGPASSNINVLVIGAKYEF